MTVFSESGRGGWQEGVSAIEPDGRRIPGQHGKIVVETCPDAVPNEVLVLNDQGGRRDERI